MADHDDWTADDDAQLRAALTSLRAEVEAAPLPDVRFVKARGMARRRQRLLSWTAAAAAAAVVVGTVGYSQLGRDASLQTPPQGRTGTSAAPAPTTPAPATSTAEPAGVSILPTADEWQESLGLAAAPRIFVPQETGLVECVDSIPDALDSHETVEAPADNVQGSQVHWLAPTTAKGPSTAKAIADQVAACSLPAFKVTGVQTSSWPRLYSYTAGDAGSGWFAIVLNAGDITLLHVVDPGHAVSTFTKAQVSDLAARAAARLKAHGGSHEGTTAPPVGPKAINEDMTVTGPQPVPSADLFVAASQWTSKSFTDGATAKAGKGDPDDTTGDIGIPCETPEYLAGIGGSLGEVEILAGPGDANVIGHQRVRVDQSADAAARSAWAKAQLTADRDHLATGCSDGGNAVTVTGGPTPGTYLLTTKVTVEATGTMYDWVGVTGLATGGAVTTIVFHGTDDGQGFQGTAAEGFAELDRLLALARQK